MYSLGITPPWILLTNLNPLPAGDNVLLVRRALGLHRDVHHRVGEVHLLQDDGVLHVAERLAGSGALEPDHRADVASWDLVDLHALVGVHPQQPPDALPLA